MLATTRAAARRVRLPECMLALLAIAFAAAAWQAMHPPARAAIGASTTFDQIAVFEPGTPATAIEAWRAAVVGRVHRQPCHRSLPCVQRVLRLSGIGPRRAELLAFDLDPATPTAEREAIAVAMADAQLPKPTLHPSTTPLHAAGG